MAFVPDRAYDDAEEVSHTAHLLFGYYCRRGGRDKPFCTASLATAAKDTGLDYTYASRKRKELVEKGWIAVIKDTVYILKGIEEYTENAQSMIANLAKTLAEKANPNCENSKKELLKQQDEIAEKANESCEKSNPPIKDEPKALTSPFNQESEPSAGARATPETDPEAGWYADKRDPPETVSKVYEVHRHYCRRIEARPLTATDYGDIKREVHRGVDVLCTAIDGMAADDWGGRFKHNGYPYLWGVKGAGSPDENIRKWTAVARRQANGKAGAGAGNQAGRSNPHAADKPGARPAEAENRGRDEGRFTPKLVIGSKI